MRRVSPVVIAVGIMLGYIVGAGLFGIPFVYVRGGIWWSVAITILAGTAMCLVHVMFLQTLAASKERMRDVAMAGTYLGPWARRTALVALILLGQGSLLAYMIAAGHFGALLVPAADPFWLSLGFYAVFALIVLRGRSFMARAELVFTAFLLFAVLAILAYVLPAAEPSSFTWLAPRGMFAVYGVALYALSGAAAVPTVLEIMKPDHRRATRAVVIGTLLALVITVAFGLVVAGVSGLRTTEEALTGLAALVGPRVVAVGAVFGLLGIITSFLPLSIYVRDVYLLDYKIPKPWAWALTLLPPLVIFMFGTQSFVRVIGFTGGVIGGIAHMIIVGSYMSARRQLGVRAAGIMRVPPFAAFLVLCALGLAVAMELANTVIGAGRG